MFSSYWLEKFEYLSFHLCLNLPTSLTSYHPLSTQPKTEPRPPKAHLLRTHLIKPTDTNPRKMCESVKEKCRRTRNGRQCLKTQRSYKDSCGTPGCNVRTPRVELVRGDCCYQWDRSIGDFVRRSEASGQKRRKSECVIL